MNVMVTALPSVWVNIYEGERRVYPGGEALNFAVHASEITGIDVTLLGAVGEDDLGNLIHRAVDYRRIDLTGVRGEKKKATAVCDKDGLHNTDIFESYKLKKKDEKAIAITDVVFVPFYASCFESVLELKKTSEFKLAVDFGNVASVDAIETVFPYADYVLITGDEVLLPILKTKSEKYSGFFNIILPNGDSVTYVGGEEHCQTAVTPDEVVDQTGCADAYHAAFVCINAMDHDLPKAMQLGAELYAVTMEHFGGF